MFLPSLDTASVGRPVTKSKSLLRVSNLVKAYDVSRDGVRSQFNAVDGVSFCVGAGEIFGLVGESGCGKSTLAKVVTSLLSPTSGRVTVGSKELGARSRTERRELLRSIQLVFQNPFASLNPRISVGRQVAEPLTVHRVGNKNEREAAARAMFATVGLSDSLFDRYPHQLSGGQNQRVAIARALILKPSIIVCDEAVSALDVSVQAQIVNLFAELRTALGVSLLFISHDLAVTRYLSDRIAVMYMGRIVETADCETLFENPHHPYSQALIEAVPDLSGWEQRVTELVGAPPSVVNRPAGCVFYSRCPRRMDKCRKSAPALVSIGPNHSSACYLDA